MHIIIKTQPIFNQRTARVGEFRYDKQGRMVITVAAMSDERFCALVALESLCFALQVKNNPYTQHQYIVDQSKRIARNFAKHIGVVGNTKRKYNKERKALD